MSGSNSLDKNNKIFPTADAVAPSVINTNENPKENKNNGKAVINPLRKARLSA